MEAVLVQRQRGFFREKTSHSLCPAPRHVPPLPSRCQLLSCELLTPNPPLSSVQRRLFPRQAVSVGGTRERRTGIPAEDWRLSSCPSFGAASPPSSPSPWRWQLLPVTTGLHIPRTSPTWRPRQGSGLQFLGSNNLSFSLCPPIPRGGICFLQPHLQYLTVCFSTCPGLFRQFLILRFLSENSQCDFRFPDGTDSQRA